MLFQDMPFITSKSFPSPSLEERFPEKIKFLPVVFVICIIGGLYAIYTGCHLQPRMQVLETANSALLESIIFHVVTGLLIVCYVLCVLVHPGSIPDKNEDPSWEYLPVAEAPHPVGSDPNVAMQEAKSSGDKRNCKWCQKYKPDRCHHCRVCRMCILKMDHHCPWIYNCVGFRNYKYFFLLLVYTTIDCHFIVWTMAVSVRAGTDPSTPFMYMFLLLFGQTLAGFLGVLVTLFLGFHIYLMLKALTTIEFCEKSQRRGGFDASAYDRGTVGNLKAVLGENPLLWFLPMAGPEGRGLSFVTEEVRLTKDLEVGRNMRRKAHQKAEAQQMAGVEPKRKTDRSFPQSPARHRETLTSGGGTGSTCQSEEESVSGSGSEEAGALVFVGLEKDQGSSESKSGAAASTAASSPVPK